MGYRLAALAISTIWMFASPSPSHTQTGPVQHRDGTSGRITPLGDDVGIYSDAHGQTGPVVRPGNPPLPDAHGNTPSTTMTPFGTPTPPNQLTPPPVLPMNPNRPLAPQAPIAPLSSSPPPGFTPSGGGRFGR